MKETILISFVLLISYGSMAQKKDSISVRSLVEKGSYGDVILGNKNKKARLSATPQMLNAADISQKKDIQVKKKENKHKKN